MTQSNLNYLTPKDPLESLQSRRQSASKSSKKRVNPPKISDQAKRNIKIMNWNMKTKLSGQHLPRKRWRFVKASLQMTWSHLPLHLYQLLEWSSQNIYTCRAIFGNFILSSLCLSQGQHKGLDKLGQNSQHFWILSRSLRLMTEGCFLPSRQKTLTWDEQNWKHL